MFHSFHSLKSTLMELTPPARPGAGCNGKGDEGDHSHSDSSVCARCSTRVLVYSPKHPTGYYYIQSVDEKTEAQGSGVTCPKSPSKYVPSRLEPRSPTAVSGLGCDSIEGLSGKNSSHQCLDFSLLHGCILSRQTLDPQPLPV